MCVSINTMCHTEQIVLRGIIYIYISKIYNVTKIWLERFNYIYVKIYSHSIRRKIKSHFNMCDINLRILYELYMNRTSHVCWYTREIKKKDSIKFTSKCEKLVYSYKCRERKRKACRYNRYLYIVHSWWRRIYILNEAKNGTEVKLWWLQQIHIQIP